MDGRKNLDRKFYLISHNYMQGGSHGIIIENEMALRPPGRLTIAPLPGSHMFPPFPEAPRLIYDKKKGRMPRDLEQKGSYWLVSDKLKNLLSNLCGSDVAFVECKFLPSSSEENMKLFLCTVLPQMDAVDPEHSRFDINIREDGSKFYALRHGTRAKIRAELVGSSHIFHATYTGSIFCDNILREACLNENITGVRFRDTNKL